MTARKQTEAVRSLLAAHQCEVTEIDVAQVANHPKRDAMRLASGKTELPQVFVGGKYVGLFGELEAANEDGQLKQLLRLA